MFDRLIVCICDTGWASLLKRIGKSVQIWLNSLYFDSHIAGGIHYPSGQIIFMRQAIDKRAETDSLYYAFYLDAYPGCVVV